MPKQVIEEYEDELERELTDEEKELLEIDEEQSTKVNKGQAEFKIVNHSKRAVKFGRVSEGDITKYVNVALEYFGHRCALSGEKFEVFDKKVNGKKTNLSAEHVVALVLGGDDIVPNIVPTVLQYNLRKNGYYILDYWNKQKDTDGKNLYSPYRLLKLVNYMMKSIDARKQGIKDVKKYRKVILTPNEIDEFLAEIEKQDEQEPDNTKKKLHSDTITATTIDEDNKKILTQVPEVEGNIPTQREQQEMTRDNEIEMMDIFLTDAVSLLKREKELQQIKLRDKDGNEITLQQKLDQMLETAIGVIPFEVKVRNTILEKLESLGIRENKYSVANDLLKNTEILGLAKQNPTELNDIVKEFIEEGLFSIDIGVTNEQKSALITTNPDLLYDKAVVEETKTNIERYKRYIGEEVDFEILNKPYLINALKIRSWMEENNTTRPPKAQYKDRNSGEKHISEEEGKLGRDLQNIRHVLIKQYQKLGKEEKEDYRKKHPELEKVKKIIEVIDEGNIKTKEDSAYYWNALAIKEWMEKNNTTKPPRIQAKNSSGNKTISEEEARLGGRLGNIRQRTNKTIYGVKKRRGKRTI